MVEEIFLLPQGEFRPLQDVSIEGLISAAVNLILVVASILFIFNFLLGGVKLIISGGDREKFDNAKRQIVNAIIGIFIVFTTWGLIRFVGEFFGVDLTTFEIPTL